MVSAPEAAVLLTIAATFDNRKPDANAARSWSVALEHIDFEDAKTAIAMHYRSSSDWIMPADVIAGIKRIEAERLADAPNLYELEIPDRIQALDGEAFDAAYRDWLQETARRLKRGLPVETGTPSPAVDDTRRIAELVASVRASASA